MAIITFAQVKGGSGKTTAAMCTVAELLPAEAPSPPLISTRIDRWANSFNVPELQHVNVTVPTSGRVSARRRAGHSDMTTLSLT